MASTIKTIYLILYNSASAIAWTTILGRVLAVLAIKGYQFVPLSVAKFARITQTFAGLEVVHSLLGTSSSFLVPPILTSVENLFSQATEPMPNHV
jgi:very-long-chain (3R)-3-hydroxyacyl-CoA dehydratase